MTPTPGINIKSMSQIGNIYDITVEFKNKAGKLESRQVSYNTTQNLSDKTVQALFLGKVQGLIDLQLAIEEQEGRKDVRITLKPNGETRVFTDANPEGREIKELKKQYKTELKGTQDSAKLEKLESTITAIKLYISHNPVLKSAHLADQEMSLEPSKTPTSAAASVTPKPPEIVITPPEGDAAKTAPTRPKPLPRPKVQKQNDDELANANLAQLQGERKIQNPILREAAKPSSPNEKAVTTHTVQRRICKHEGNTCFVNTALQLCAHFKEYGKLFDTPLVQRNGEPNAAFQKRKDVQELGRQMIDQLRNPQEGQPVTGAFKFLQALEACGEMDKSAEDFKRDGGDPTNVIMWITNILVDTPEGKKGPPAPIPPAPQGANTAFIKEHALAGPAQDNALDQRNAMKDNLANKECCFLECDIKNPQPIKPEILVPEVKDGKTVMVIYQLEVVMSGGTGHTYPCIRSGENFIEYNDWPADPPPKPKVIPQSEINTIPNVRRCYYVKKNPQ